jgi:flagellar hook-length control protein FliK
VPRVASEPNAILPPRAPTPTIRSRSEADGGEDSTPFAKLLDDASTAAEPQPAASRERPDAAAPAKDSATAADIKGGTAADQGGDTAGGKPAAEATTIEVGTKATDAAKAKLIKKAEESLDADKPADATGKPAPDADATASLDAPLSDAAPAATAPPVPTPDASAAAAVAAPPADIAAASIATPDVAPETGQLAALQGVGKRAAPDGAGKPGLPQGETQAKTDAAAGTNKPVRTQGQPQAEAPASTGADNTSETQEDAPAKAAASNCADVSPQTQGQAQAKATASIGADNAPPAHALAQVSAIASDETDSVPQTQGEAQNETQVDATASVGPGKPTPTQKAAQAKIAVSVTAAKIPQAQGEAQAKATSNGEPPQSPPQVEPGKGGEAQSRNESVAGNSPLAAGDQLPKAGIDGPSQRHVDAAGAVKTGSDAMQNLGLLTPANQGNTTSSPAAAATSLPAPGQAPPLPQAVAVPLAGVAVEIATQALADKHRFEIRLDPPELGRIDVRLDVDADGNVTSRLTADRVETLDLLRRESAQLERALQQAGLKTSDNALEFSLRQQAFARDDTAPQNTAQLIVPDDDPAPLEALRQGYGRLLGLGGGLDIRV